MPPYIYIDTEQARADAARRLQEELEKERAQAREMQKLTEVWELLYLEKIMLTHYLLVPNDDKRTKIGI